MVKIGWLIAIVIAVQFPAGASSPKPPAHVIISRVLKKGMVLQSKAFEAGRAYYDSRNNIWYELDDSSQRVKINLRPVYIGTKKTPSYYLPGNLMADNCERKYFVITDQPYAIVLSEQCDTMELDKFASTYSLPPRVQAILVKEDKAWKTYETGHNQSLRPTGIKAGND